MRITIAILCIVLFSPLVFSATIYVPDNYPTIQGAMNASMAGDTVVVRPGTYLERIDFFGKAITVRSELGANVTVIDGGGTGPVVTFASEENSASVLEGFTVTNAVADYSGIYCGRRTSPTITGNRISGNTSRCGVFCYSDSQAVITRNIISGNGSPNTEGGGIICNDSSPIISHNMITGNKGWTGGGISCLYHSNPHIANNIIRENRATKYGGGIYCERSSPTIEKNIIRRNVTSRASSDGGGIYCTESGARILTNTVTGNATQVRGGGIYCYLSPLLVDGNRIMGNRALKGGGMYCNWHSTARIFSNLFTTNWAGEYGGGIHSGYCCPSLANNTVAGNRAEREGGGVFFGDQATLTDSIIWGNSAPTGPELVDFSGLSSVTYCDIQGGYPGTGNIDSDPLFADLAKDDFHIKWASPCRDSGNGSSSSQTDIEGDPRVTGGTVDIGADEFYYHLYRIGDVLPGAPIDIKVVGIPGFPTLLALGTGIQDPPQSTQYGDLWLKLPLAKSWQLGPIPNTGILIHSATVPSGWSSGSTHPFQALVGLWGSGVTKLTNSLLIEVE